MSTKAQARKKRTRRTIRVLLCEGCDTEIGISTKHDELHADKGRYLVEMDPEDAEYLH